MFDQPITFTCNICGTISTVPSVKKHRELLQCNECGSTPRYRGIFQAIQKYVLGSTEQPVRLTEPRLDKMGIGMSDWEPLVPDLQRVVSYRNTFYHQEPRLDITNAKSCKSYKNLDFIICSEVLEHVLPPVSQCLINIKGMLKTDGILILSVPYLEGYETIEHFPHIDRFEITPVGDRHSLVNIAPDGTIEHFDNIIFHGGPGSVLEMRIFGEGDILAMLSYSGFTDVTIMEPTLPEIGYIWDYRTEHPLWRGRLGKSCILICRQQSRLAIEDTTVV